MTVRHRLAGLRLGVSGPVGLEVPSGLVDTLDVNTHGPGSDSLRLTSHDDDFGEVI